MISCELMNKGDLATSSSSQHEDIKVASPCFA